MKTDTQLRNINRLADFLDNLPSNYPHFDMEDYYHPHDHGQFSSEMHEIFASISLSDPVLGDCGCALGHSMAAGITNSSMESTWRDFAKMAYGVEGAEFDHVFMDINEATVHDPKVVVGKLRALLRVDELVA